MKAQIPRNVYVKIVCINKLFIMNKLSLNIVGKICVLCLFAESIWSICLKMCVTTPTTL